MNIYALIAVSVLYIFIIIVGLWASCKKKWRASCEDESQDMLAGRNIGCFVGAFSLTAAWIGSSYINGTAGSVYAKGIAHSQIGWCYALSLIIGGLVFAKKMRMSGYVTMFDPFQEKYGVVMTALLSLISLAGELFWSASMLSSLGGMISRIVGIKSEYAIIGSMFAIMIYTLIGGLYAIVYTGVIQLICIFVGLWVAVPFAMISENVNTISTNKEVWLGHIDNEDIGRWIDQVLLLTLGSIPWQFYFQRVLSAKSPKTAQALSFFASFGCLIMVLPVVLIGIVAKSTDWDSVFRENGTNLVEDGIIKEPQMVFSLVIQYLTPSGISIVGLVAISAVVMSSVDSSILSWTSIFTHNIYNLLFRKKASLKELVWITRLGVIIASIACAAMGIKVKPITQLWLLSCDVIYVLLFPQLLCAVYLKFANVYGSVFAALVGLVLRFCGGDENFGIPALIKYSFYDTNRNLQLFPFRTFSMGVSLLSLILFSLLVNCLKKSKGTDISQDEIDILRISYKEGYMEEEAPSFSKITGLSGSYNNIAAGATELRIRDDKSLLRYTLTKDGYKSPIEGVASI